MSGLQPSSRAQPDSQGRYHGLRSGQDASHSSDAVGRATYSFINKGTINTYTAEVTADGRVINGHASTPVNSQETVAVALTPKVIKQFEDFAREYVRKAREKTPGQYAQVSGNITQEADLHRRTLLDKASTEDVLQKVTSTRTQTTGVDFTPEQLRVALTRDPKAVQDWVHAHPDVAKAKFNDPRYATIARQYAAENPNTTISMTFKKLGSQNLAMRPGGSFGGLS